MADIIAAVATGWQRSAIGILRVSGGGCDAVAARVFRAKDGRPFSALRPRTLTLGSLLDRQGRVIDEALAVRTPGPGSYTGEDTVELQCHGSPAVLAAGLDALFAAGARQAGPGEFTRRAFLNGRMDLTQAEAVADLIDAETAEQAANAAGQLGGAIRRRVEPLYDTLAGIMAHFHAVLDYPDEDIPPFALAQTARTLEQAQAELEALLATAGRGRFLREGVRAVLLGRPNVGKSSLLNALAGYERAIVTPIPGTTRDTVEETVTLGGVLLRLTDTAGIRETDDAVEALGVARAEAAAQQAALALYVCDGTRLPDAADRRAMAAARRAPVAIALRNKCDLGAAEFPLPGFDAELSVSAKTGAGLDRLAALLAQRYGAAPGSDTTLLVSTRQTGAIRRACAALACAREALEAGLTPDAVLTDVEAALEALGEITGKIMREEITNRIFERFCVGK